MEHANTMNAAPDQKPEQTIGEKRIRTNFNPSGVGNVNFLKNTGAQTIDVLDEMKREAVESEHLRLIDIAQQKQEDATMWAVKAATFNL